MDYSSHLLIVAGGAGFAWTAVRFLADTRYVNSDGLGASIRFDRRWMISALALSAGLALRPEGHWAAVPIVLVVAYAMIPPLKWRVIKPLGRRLGIMRGFAPGTEPSNGFARLAEVEARLMAAQSEALRDRARSALRDGPSDLLRANGEQN